jgi:acetoin utilization deacetylase AcuC-like enzyme
MLSTGIVKDRRYLNHLTPDDHPETPRRLEVIYAMLEEADMRERFVEIPPRPARRDDILMVHTAAHFDKLAATAGQDAAALTPDTLTSAQSFDTALLAAGGLLEAVKIVTAGELRNAFALIRPPGHHAEKSRAMGYCLFNNVAVAARYARNVLGLQRVLIVDWDVHHGNGTAHAFERDASVLFFSIHQYPHFPGTGYFTEAGIGPGEGYSVNVPIPRGYGDAEYAALFELLLRPLALEFRPDLILVSAGFDIHPADSMGRMHVTNPGFAALTRSLMDIADTCCGGRLVLALEGGYHIETIADSVKCVLNELSDITRADPAGMAADADRKKLAYVLKRSGHVHRHRWDCFSHSVKKRRIFGAIRF